MDIFLKQRETFCLVPIHIVPKGTGLSNRTSREAGHYGCDLAPSEREGRMPVILMGAELRAVNLDNPEHGGRRKAFLGENGEGGAGELTIFHQCLSLGKA